MAMANVLGYVSVILVSGKFGPSAFGAVAALTNLGIIAAIPAGALQVLVARRSSNGHDSTAAYALSALVGAVVWILIVVSSPVLARVFDLSSVWPLFWLGLTLIPMTMVGAQQGLLLGSQQLGRLSVLFLFAGVARLVATAWCVVAEPTITGAFMAWAIASLAGLLVGHELCRNLLPLQGSLRGLVPLALALARSSLALLALIVFTSIDTILARHFLSAHDSGIYGVSSMFAKVIFWGTQFVAMVVVPRLAKQHAQLLVIKAYSAIVVIALPVIAIVAVDPGFWLSVVGLDAYSEAGTLLIGFAVLGLFWSLTQVSVFIDMGVGQGTVTKVVLAGILVQLMLTFLWLHSSPTQVWLATLIASIFVTSYTLCLMAVATHNVRRQKLQS